MDTSSHQDRLMSYLFGPMQDVKTTRENDSDIVRPGQSQRLVFEQFHVEINTYRHIS